jgi:S1-C subfamily serine protease
VRYAAAGAPQDILLLRAPANAGLGLAVRDRAIDPRAEVGAVVVTAVVEGSRADLAGIQPRDVIEAVDETEVQSRKQLLAILANTPSGGAVKLKIRRGRVRLDIGVVPQPLGQ